jgi:hypothetical protein
MHPVINQIRALAPGGGRKLPRIALAHLPGTAIRSEKIQGHGKRNGATLRAAPRVCAPVLARSRIAAAYRAAVDGGGGGGGGDGAVGSAARGREPAVDTEAEYSALKAVATTPAYAAARSAFLATPPFDGWVGRAPLPDAPP